MGVLRAQAAEERAIEVGGDEGGEGGAQRDRGLRPEAVGEVTLRRGPERSGLRRGGPRLPASR